MNGLPLVVWLQAAPEPGLLSNPFVPMIAILLIFYFLLIRPQQRRQKEHEQMLKAVGKGDRIVSAGGIHGEVIGTSEDVLTVEIANVKGERVRIKLDRSRVDRRLEKAKKDES